MDPEIQKLLEVYDTIFMKHKRDIGLTKLTKHDIITEGPPVVINPRRQPVHLLKQIEENINEVQNTESSRNVNHQGTPHCYVLKRMEKTKSEYV